MYEVLIKSFTFILIICIGYIFKKKKILKKEDADTLATIIMNITLPCALLSSANGIKMELTIYILIIWGIFANVMMLLIGYLSSRKENSILKATYMLNCSSYNIGNFVLPFVTTFFLGTGVAYLCAFDIGNALMGLGISYAIADGVASGQTHLNLKELVKKLFSSIPFDVYLIVFLFAILKISFPAPLLSIVSTIGSGNAFLAMLMIGLLLEIKIPSAEKKGIMKIVFLRLLGTILMGLVIYLFFPLPLLAKKILILALSGPIATITPVFSKKIGYQGDMSAAANSITILISIVIMTILLMLFA